MKMSEFMLWLVAIAGLSALPVLATAQSLADSGDSSSASVLPSVTPNPQSAVKYTRPTEKTRLRNYFFDAFGPYPIVGAALAAGINQADNTPPEWKQGAVGYGKRFGSDFGIAATTTTTRYALARAFGEDTLYYRCECKEGFPRLGHAVISTFTARRGHDGHRVFSLPALVAPYAGTMAAVYRVVSRPLRCQAMHSAWATTACWGTWAGTSRLNSSTAGPHSLLSRIHLNNTSRSTKSGYNSVIEPRIQGGREHVHPPLPGRRTLYRPVSSSKGFITEFLEWFGDLGIFSWQVVRAAVTPPYEFRELFRQLDELGSKSLPLVALAGAATGVVLSLEARYSLTRFGAKSLLPAAIVFSVIHETGPIITGLVVSGRAGAGIGAELASM